MTSHLFAVRFEAIDPARLARFWAGVLRWEPTDDRQGGITLVPTDGTAYRVRFVPTRQQRPDDQNRMHFDLTSTSLEDQQQTVDRVLELGGRHLDVGQGPDEPHVVLADPEGNELCVIEPGNKFLADCGFIGAINCDGSQQVGYFWSKALDWPLVWDQDEETAIQSPLGGSKMAWGGPPVAPKNGRNRLTLDLTADGDRQTEIDRLVSLGARLDGDQLFDPDDNEFSVLTTG